MAVAQQLLASFGSAGGGSTSYANNGGTGNRTSIITVTSTAPWQNNPPTSLLDGDTTSGSRNFMNSASVSGTYTRFDFGSGVVIDEVKYYQENSTWQGDWKWQGSNDASTWTDIGSSFTLGTSATQTITTLTGNTTAYRYYRLLGVSGTANSGPWIYQMEFKIYGI